MVTPNERTILEIAAKDGGTASFGKLSSNLGLNTEMISITCKSLKARGYVQLPDGRRITLTTKGLRAGGKNAEENFMKAQKLKDEKTLHEIEQELSKDKRGWRQMSL